MEEYPIETHVIFEKRLRCPLDEWYRAHRGSDAPNLELMAPYFITHQGKGIANRNFLLVEYEGQPYFCKLCIGGKGVLNEYKAHDILDPLNSPHIVKIEHRIILTESCRGAFLTKIYNQYERAVLRPFTKVVMRQLFEALSVIHSNNIVHLDIKPQNIVWEWKDNQPHIYVIDFGLSYTVDDKKLLFHTNTEGSWLYMSPERLDHWGEDRPTDFRILDVVCRHGLRRTGMHYNNKIEASNYAIWKLLDRFLFNKISRDILLDFLKDIDSWFADVDPLAFDLIKHLLALHTERYTADQALQHPYFHEK